MGRLISLTSLPSPLSYRYVSLSLLIRPTPLHSPALARLLAFFSLDRLYPDPPLRPSLNGSFHPPEETHSGAWRRMREKRAVQRDLLASAGPEAGAWREGSPERPSSPLSLDRDDLESQLALTLAERQTIVYGRFREHGLSSSSEGRQRERVASDGSGPRSFASGGFCRP